MNYWRDNNDLRSIHGNLRNKNLAVFSSRRALVDKALDRLYDRVSHWRIRRMQTIGYKLVVSEQIVENPLVFRNLRPGDKSVLDFGGFESVLPLQLSAIGYHVTVWDQRAYPFRHPNLDVLCQDLFVTGQAMDQTFDVIVSVSTIEHLGLGAYGDQAAPDADKRGVEILWGLLNREHGRLMASVPAGKPSVQRGYRVYDEARLRQVFPRVTSIFWYKKEGREGVWTQVEADAVANLEYGEPYSQMPVEAIAFVICDKGMLGAL